MANKKSRYSEEFRKTIVELYKSGKNLSELSSEYGIPKSTMYTTKDMKLLKKMSKKVWHLVGFL